MDTSNWKWFKLGSLFRIEKGKRLTKADMLPGIIPYYGGSPYARTTFPNEICIYGNFQ